MIQKSYDGSPTLYIVPTPIGNLEDITIRALNILKEVDVIFAEDTRTTKQLLNHFEINKKLISSHLYNENQNEEKELDYLREGKNIAVVSDRGTPVISDPGYILVKKAIEHGYNVVCLPGPTAVIPALVMSGLSGGPFTFYGFLNSKESKRKKELESLKMTPYPIAFYEAPHRLMKTLNNIYEISLMDKTSSTQNDIAINPKQTIFELQGAKFGEGVFKKMKKDDPTLTQEQYVATINMGLAMSQVALTQNQNLSKETISGIMKAAGAVGDILLSKKQNVKITLKRKSSEMFTMKEFFNIIDQLDTNPQVLLQYLNNYDIITVVR